MWKPLTGLIIFMYRIPHKSYCWWYRLLCAFVTNWMGTMVSITSHIRQLWDWQILTSVNNLCPLHIGHKLDGNDGIDYTAHSSQLDRNANLFIPGQHAEHAGLGSKRFIMVCVSCHPRKRQKSACQQGISETLQENDITAIHGILKFPFSTRRSVARTVRDHRFLSRISHSPENQHTPDTKLYAKKYWNFNEFYPYYQAEITSSLSWSSLTSLWHDPQRRLPPGISHSPATLTLPLQIARLCRSAQ